MSHNFKSNNNIDLKLLILDNNCSEKEYNDFILQYEKNNKDLYFNITKNETNPQNIFNFIPEGYNRWINNNYKIYYIINNTKIIAFCIIEDDIEHKIIDVILLCSSTEKKFINGISLGKYLLNTIYNNVVENNYLMRINPYTPELIPYYIEWKNPIFNELNETFMYLIYGDLNSASNKTFNKIFYSLFRKNKLKKYLNISTNINNINNPEELKKIFREKLAIIKPENSGFKQQMSRMINEIKYVKSQIRTIAKNSKPNNKIREMKNIAENSESNNEIREMKNDIKQMKNDIIQIKMMLEK